MLRFATAARLIPRQYSIAYRLDTTVRQCRSYVAPTKQGASSGLSEQKFAGIAEAALETLSDSFESMLENEPLTGTDVDYSVTLTISHLIFCFNLDRMAF